ncbi:MAG TPA: Ig-like domain-containing protein [Vicinamibacterales bacterium]|nr:Ig-like domain-containing protein [Vicinamibacterales bacterium]
MLLSLAAMLLTAPRTSAQLGSLVVSITAPQNGATVSGTTPINASVTIIGLITVSKVEFYRDGVFLGEDTSAPYSIPWNTTTTSNGSHTLTAIGRSLNLLGFGSPAVTVTVFNDTTPPTVAIAAPAAGATLRGAVTITANASDNVGVTGVQFKVDGVNLGGEDTTAPYSVSWNTTTAAGGAHTVTAVARDAAGNTATATTVNVTVDNTPPTVSVTAPAAGSLVKQSITVSANASDNIAVAGVQFLVNGTAIGAEDLLAPYEATWDTTSASDGSNTVTAVARDAAGNSTTSGGVTLLVDNTAPAIGITSPAAGSNVSGTITVTAGASDAVAVAGVQFFLDGTPLGAEDTAAPYEVSWNTTTAATGPHTLTATARDTAGNARTSAGASVTVSNQVETVTRVEENNTAVTHTGNWLLGYTDSRGWSGGTVSLGYMAGDRATLNFSGTGVSWIGFRGPQTGIAIVHLDGVQVATVDAYSATETVQTALYTVSGLANGPHTLAIEVTRTKNEASSEFYVVVDAFDVITLGPPDTTAPAVSVTSPAAGATVSAAVSITADASDAVGVAGVKFFVDGVQLGPEDTVAPYVTTWNTVNATNGNHEITARARDVAGNTTTSAVVTVTVSNAPPPPPAAAATRFEDTDLSVTYTHGIPAPGQPPTWFHGSRSRDWSNGTSTFNRSAGARATFSFTGTSVSWNGFRAYWAGIAKVYVDGTFVADVDLFLPQCTPEQKAQGCIDEDDQIPAFTASNLAPGPHTLTVESTGTKNPASIDYAVVIDGFDVAPPMPPSVMGTRLEETTMSYSTGWTQGDTSGAWSGGAAAVATAAGSRATVTFTGTEARWIGARGPNAGIARIYLDGAFQAEVDLYNPTQIQGTMYTATGLAPGSHTMAVEVTGNKHPASSGTTLVVDAIDIRSRFEERDASVSVSGTWQEHMDSNWSGTSPNTGGGAALRANTAGATAEITFNGSAVQWISSRAPDSGIAEVSLDGGPVTQVDLYAATQSLQVPVFSASGLAAGPHTLRISVTGQRNASATNSWVPVDAFDVTLPEPAPPVTRIQQTDTSVSYTAPSGPTAWTFTSANKFYSGRTVHFAAEAGARATFTFSGTGVRWIGQRRRDGGIAKIILDGVEVAQVDTFNAIQDEFQASVYSVTGLTPGTHTLTIEVTGTKRGGPDCVPGATPCSSGFLIFVDAFDIYPN